LIAFLNSGAKLQTQHQNHNSKNLWIVLITDFLIIIKDKT